MVRLRKVSVGDMVRVCFLDHAELDQPMAFEVFGRVLSVERRGYRIGCWLLTDPTQKHMTDDEVSYFILKSAIESIQVLHAESLG